ncbi:hypothetical protein CW354_08040 [Marinicaulis flavus]|uniref:TonB-dependent receptor n=2 Tax=Hyphococcus luteus TaxID=2058213 RepID=A0A2S7K6U9_9PROT|nr:hypothetical protein CW354_08040 [Marinicaulis flavus]
MSMFMGGALAQEAEEADADAVLDVIVVPGVRGSLSRALDQKESATGVVDAISAEDIGKFPDLNISESLARISGVTITRTPGGEGNVVSVRGGQTDWTNVTVNGLSVATGNVGREFSFDLFASELFSNAKVYKSSSADIAEGGLTATIDLRTPQPLGTGNKIAFSASGTDFHKGNGDLQPRVSGLLSRTFDNDRFGVLVSASYSKTAARGDISQGWGWDDNITGLQTYLSGFTTDNAPTIMVNGEAVNDLARLQDIAANTISPELPRIGPNILERERLGVTGSFQFRPTENVELFADILYADYSQDEIRATVDGMPGFGTGQEWTSITIEDGVAVAGSISNQDQRSETLDRQVDSTLTHITTGGKWDIDGVWSADATFGYSKAKEDELSRTYLWHYVGDFTYDFSNPKYPELGGDFDWLDPDQYSPNQLRFRPFQRNDEEISVSANLGADFGDTGLTGVKFGVQYRDRDKGQVRLAELRPAFTANFADYAISARDMFGSSYHEDAPYRSDFLMTNIETAGRDLLPADLSLTEVDKLQTYTVGEETLGAYFKADLAFDIGPVPVTMDSGVRYVRTDVTSEGYVQEESGPEAVSYPGKYSDWLPAINLKAQLRDNLILRIAANRTMTRPPLANLAPAVNISPTVLSASRGNPALEPYRSNNIDASLEWYFADEALLSATVYYKDLETFIVNETRPEIVICGDIRNDAGENVCGREFQVTTPVNGENGKLYGLELQYQQPFTFLPAPFDGFGVLANATFSESERTDEAGVSKPLQGQSDTSYNLVGYYEKGPFSARLAYNYRSEFSVTGRNGFDNIQQPYGQVDASARYAVTDHFDLFLEGLNLFEEDWYTYAARTNSDGSVNDFGKQLNQYYLTQGRVIQFGIRGTF